MEQMPGKRKNSTMYVIDRFAYKVSSNHGGRVYMMCAKNLTCPARGQNFEGKLTLSSPHNHGPDDDMINEVKFVTECKRRAETESTSLREIYNQECKRFKKIRVSFNNIESTMNKRRMQVAASTLPKKTDNIGKAVNDSLYKTTNRGKPFFSAQLKFDNSQVLVFISPIIHEIVTQVHEIQIGVLSYHIPEPFSYLCCIHTEYRQSSLSFVYALMTDTSQKSYNVLLVHLRNILPKMVLTNIVTNFDYNLKQACNIVYPKSSADGCYYSYGQLLWRQVVTLDLEKEYKNNESIQRVLRMCLTLPLLPNHFLAQGFELIRQEMETSVVVPEVEDPLESSMNDEELREALTALIEYISSEWMPDQVNLSVWDQPTRSSHQVHFMLIQMKRKIGHVTETMWKFLKKIRDIEASQCKALENLQKGKPISTRIRAKQLYLVKNLQIVAAAEKVTLGTMTLLEFLNIVANIIPEPTDDQYYGLEGWEMKGNAEQQQQLQAIEYVQQDMLEISEMPSTSSDEAMLMLTEPSGSGGETIIVTEMPSSGGEETQDVTHEVVYITTDENFEI